MFKIGAETSLKSAPWLQYLDPYTLLFKRLPAAYRPQDAVLHLIVLTLFLASIVIRIVNHFTFHYTTLNFSSQFVSALPGLVLVWIIGLLMSERWPRLGLLLSSASQMFLFIVVCVYALASAITTPFPIIDHFLLHADQAVGFSTVAVMTWVHQHHWAYRFFSFCYESWFWEILAAPLVLALFKARAEIDRYVIATFLSFLVGGMIYYFWPTIAPAGVLHSGYFSQSQHELVQRFSEVHQSLAITVFGGGMVAFPSFHVINSLIVLFTFRRYRLIFWPLLLLNTGSILATLALGYHYLLDVLAGFLIAFAAIYCAKYLVQISATH